MPQQELLTFVSRSEWRSWLEENHCTIKEAWLIHFKKLSGRSSITYDEALAEALCFGWIDGKKRSIDAERYAFRFTPRGANSAWSELNITRAKALIRAGKMTAAGLRAFKNHKQRKIPPLPETLPAELQEAFKSHTAAWQNFLAFPPGYRRVCIGWVASAKREETQFRRLSMLIEHSAANTKIRFM